MSRERFNKLWLRRFEILGLLPDKKTVTVWHQGRKGFHKVTLDTLVMSDRLRPETRGYLGKLRGHRNKGWIIWLVNAGFAVNTCVAADAKKAERRVREAIELGEIKRIGGGDGIQ